MSRPDPHPRLVKARERADLARMRFMTALNGTKRRVSPERLKDDALVAIGDRIEEAKHEVRQTIKRHPLATVSAAAGVVAIMFWKPARLASLYGLRASRVVWLNRALWRLKR